jgi:hypothetical protein
MRARSALLGAASAGPLLAVRRWSRSWGSTPAERSAALPGDDLVPDPVTSVTRAVTVDAPAERVWPWLAQMGQGRGGMYSYDRLENAIGLDIHSATHIDPRWQHLEVGDRVVLVRQGWPVIPQGFSLPVAAVEPGHHLVLRQTPEKHGWDATWAFVLQPDGPSRCRLITRSRSAGIRAEPGWVVRLLDEVMSPVQFVMERRMLLGIKQRAEST